MRTAPTDSGSIDVLSTLLAEQSERLSHCVHCGFCLPACPTYVRLGDEADSPRGRLHLMGAVAEGRLEAGSPAFQRHIDRCLGCRACETVCPSGVEYGHLLERAREVAGRARRPSFLSRALLTAVSNPSLLKVWMGPSRLARALGLPQLALRLLPDRPLFATPRLGLAMLAASAPTTMREWPSEEPAAAGNSSHGKPEPRGRVGLLRGCVQNQLFRRVNEATRRTLEANGWEVVEVPAAGCCGALHAHAGELGSARDLARTNIRAFRAANVEWVAVNAAGCGATMREYEELVSGDDDAIWFSERVRDITELLAGEGREPRIGAAVPVSVAYDPPCHLLHGQRVSDPPLRLLRSIPGLEVIPVPKGDECCGGAGIYGLTHPELGGRIGADKVEAVLSTGAGLVATGNPGCAMQIGGGLRLAGSDLRVVHPIELLDESYRRAGMYQ